MCIPYLQIRCIAPEKFLEKIIQPCAHANESLVTIIIFPPPSYNRIYIFQLHFTLAEMTSYSPHSYRMMPKQSRTWNIYNLLSLNCITLHSSSTTDLSLYTLLLATCVYLYIVWGRLYNR